MNAATGINTSSLRCHKCGEILRADDVFFECAKFDAQGWMIEGRAFHRACMGKVNEEQKQ